MDSRVVTLLPTIVLLALLGISAIGPGGLEWGVIVLLLAVQAVWAVIRLGGWLKEVVESAAGMD